MSNIQDQIILKNKVVNCLKACGAITGKYMQIICPDENAVQMMMNDSTIRKIVVEAKGPNKTKRKIYLFELFDKIKPTQFPAFTEDDAKKIYAMNTAFFEQEKNATGWFDVKDIKNYVKNCNVKIVRRPDLMFFTDNGIVAIYVNAQHHELSDSAKEKILNSLEVAELIEYLY